jgi:uncharacterized protein (TIGR03435 family)
LSVGGPAWTATDKFQIDAKSDDESHATKQDLLQMLQGLLSDRFTLKLHRERKESAGYALLLGNNGPTLKQTSAAEELPHIDFGGPRPAVPQQTTIVGKSRLQSLAEFLVPFVSEGTTASPVLDKTGLTGTYDYALTVKLPGPGPRGGGGGDLRDALGSALQEQLGLRLESAKVSEEVMVIDHAEKPPAN